MSEMVEIVARAMYAAAAEAGTQEEFPGWNAELYFRRAAYVANARAAIAAMREPTDAMKATAFLLTTEHHGRVAIYQAMIDTALEA